GGTPHYNTLITRGDDPMHVTNRPTVFFLLISVVAVGQTSLSAVTTAAPPASASTQSSTDWPGFLGPHRNGKSDERGLPTTFPPKGPPVVWYKPVGTGYSAPAISNGR